MSLSVDLVAKVFIDNRYFDRWVVDHFLFKIETDIFVVLHFSHCFNFVNLNLFALFLDILFCVCIIDHGVVKRRKIITHVHTLDCILEWINFIVLLKVLYICVFRGD